MLQNIHNCKNGATQADPGQKIHAVVDNMPYIWHIIITIYNTYNIKMAALSVLLTAAHSSR